MNTNDKEKLDRIYLKTQDIKSALNNVSASKYAIIESITDSFGQFLNLNVDTEFYGRFHVLHERLNSLQNNLLFLIHTRDVDKQKVCIQTIEEIENLYYRYIRL
jgi:hypothetical protein